MEYNSNLLIAVDAGHGGWDNGAGYLGRAEKDDNLRLAKAVQRQLLAQGVRVLMTRDSDVYVTLQDRARIANEVNADLFVSLHRNSYIEQTPSTMGVENFIYLTAPWETSGVAAQNVLDEVVSVGVQENRGVKRGNYYVIRRTRMPAMLLEMGYIVNDIDNLLFDEHLDDYAAAITKGILHYFGREYQNIPGVTPEPPPDLPPSPVGPTGLPPETPAVQPQPLPEPLPQNAVERIQAAQSALHQKYEIELPVTGRYDAATRRAVTQALQRELNLTYGLGIPVDGIPGQQTFSSIRNFTQGNKGNLVFLLQVLLALRGYNPGPLDGVFTPQTTAALQAFQRDSYLAPDGIAGPAVFERLLG